MAAAADLQVGLTPIVQALGVDLEEVQVQGAGRRTVVRVIVDRDGGMDLDSIAEVTHAVSRALDESPLAQGITGAYLLEVSSPGVERPLTTATHWRRALGRRVRVELVDGQVIDGRVSTCGEHDATLHTGSGPQSVAFDEVARAVVQVEFTAVPDGGAHEEGTLDEDTDDEADDDDRA